MYKSLLCLRYLRTRYIALASIISMTLGVATMIVVNSVMDGFSTDMRDRLRGILADVIVETNSLDGEPNTQDLKDRIQRAVGNDIEGMTATVEIYAMLSVQYGSQWQSKPVTLIGIDPATKATVGPLSKYLVNTSEASIPDWELSPAAMAYRKEWTTRAQWMVDRWNHNPPPMEEEVTPVEKPDSAEPLAPPKFDSKSDFESPFDSKPQVAEETDSLSNPFDKELNESVFDKAEKRDPGSPLKGRVYIGYGLVSFPYEDPDTGETKMFQIVKPGDDVKISTVTAGHPPEPTHFNATVVDLFKSEMSEHDSSLVFCNLEYLQEMRGMIDPESDEKSITSIQIKLKNPEDAAMVVSKLEEALPAGQRFRVRTWEDKQGPLLAAVEVESAILNVLLFLIIAVAGFGILAIFFMITLEKTRDIGILKALGASSNGIMSIFLSYGLALGLVGSGVGVVVGLLFVRYINEIEKFITFITGRKVFDQRIYYFPEIATHVEPMMVFWVAFGAMVIAVLASILPARKAARFHPVESLRYE
ncbi:MAG: FtsX-like permease family protein [Planctomycetes bacterium]|nr:FtsX-like permease family protein [Planctomycetota bacterium]MCH9726372.1 FtsX-like permease family protein [Planctomycetota bacterium]MCH9775888.1 FtsX-like permease family protein [Planctomycetota bacterium]MCH9791295.1 FtsX-like permease family protein [Planctomycetota bacterium]MDF1742992.1 FtsX-like permease family protein [Gimesia sp.]